MARIYRKIVKKIAPELRKVLNSTLQGEKGQKSDLYTFWWGRIVQALTRYKQNIRDRYMIKMIQIRKI